MKTLAAVMIFGLLALPGRVQAYECSTEVYKDAYPKMDALFRAGTLQKGTGGALSVMINEAAWGGLTFNQKQAFADRLVCSIAGVGKGLYSLDIQSNMTGKVIGAWKLGTLSVP